VLRLDEDDSTFKATLLLFMGVEAPQGEDEWTITGRRVIYDQAHVIYDFHTFNDGDRVNYVLIRDEGLLAGIGDEKSFILGDK
jgi:hypothetical protein